MSNPSQAGTPTIADCGANNALTLTVQHTYVTGSDGAAYAVVAWSRPDSETISSVTYDGLAMTQVASRTQGTENGIAIYRRFNPPTTSNANVVVTMSASTRIIMGVLSYNNIHQSLEGTPSYAEVDEDDFILVSNDTSEEYSIVAVNKRNTTEAISAEGSFQSHLLSDQTTNATAGNNRILDIDVLTTDPDADTADASWTWATPRTAVAVSFPLTAASSFAGTPASDGHATFPFGVVALISVNKAPSQAILDDAAVHGVALRPRWTRLEPTEGAFSWTWLDSRLDDAEEAGKFVTLRLMVSSAPDWAKVGVTQFTRDSDGNTKPVFYDPLWLSRKRNLMKACAERYKNDTRIRAISGQFAQFTSDDWNIPHDAADNTAWLNTYGYSTGLAIQTGIDWMDFMFSVWTGTTAVTLSTGTNGDLDADPYSVPQAVCEYAYHRYAPRFFNMRNALSAFSATYANSLNSATFKVAGMFAPYGIAFQNLWYVSGDTTYRMNNGNPGTPLTILSSAVSRGNGYPARWQEIYSVDLLDSTLRTAWNGQIDHDYNVAAAAHLLRPGVPMSAAGPRSNPSMSKRSPNVGSIPGVSPVQARGGIRPR